MKGKYKDLIQKITKDLPNMITTSMLTDMGIGTPQTWALQRKMKRIPFTKSATRNSHIQYLRKDVIEWINKYWKGRTYTKSWVYKKKASNNTVSLDAPTTPSARNFWTKVKELFIFVW